MEKTHVIETSKPIIGYRRPIPSPIPSEFPPVFPPPYPLPYPPKEEVIKITLSKESIDISNQTQNNDTTNTTKEIKVEESSQPTSDRYKTIVDLFT